MGQTVSTTHDQRAPSGGFARRAVIWLLLTSLAAMFGHDAALARAETADTPTTRVSGLGYEVAWRIDHARSGMPQAHAMDARSSFLDRYARDGSRDIECGARFDFHVAKRVLQLRVDVLTPSDWFVNLDAVADIIAVAESHGDPTVSPQVRRALLQVYRI